ncbi:hypothetical protein GCM10010383_34960 [Streptomyces lomondensis]|uniref:B3/B4 tRNA-binding domain-containing protein n=1 Tax=Streptomyces lomondensis TaxID=68229 RepID=A0ABQ2X6J1_9ACTN|nr:hypothetical protein GCM10010383_34960 [Streptomyces lomondensis]
MTLTLTVSDDVRALAPGFTHVAIEAHGLVNGPSTDAGSALLGDAARRLAARLDGRAPHEDPHMAAWREAYTAFGAKPSRTRNSAEALAKRALSEAGLPRINLLVDLYNAVSVAHLIPVGGEDIDRIQGGMRLVGHLPAGEHGPDAGRRGGGGSRRTRRTAGEVQPGSGHRRTRSRVLRLSPGPGRQRASACRTCSGVGAVPPRWAGIHQVSSGPFGRTG